MRKINNIAIAVILVLVGFAGFAQKSEGVWHLNAGGTGIDHGKSIAVDVGENVYVTGGFQEKMFVGSSQLTANGDSDIFISKYDKSGNPIWIVQAGSDTVLNNVLSEFGSKITLSHNALYVTGTFFSTAKFGTDKIKSRGKDDIFLAKYSLDGALIWVKGFGGESQDLPSSIAVDEIGNVYLTGSFQKVAYFDNLKLDAQHSINMFVAKFDQKGDLLWIKQSSGVQSSGGKALKFADNYCYLVGEFQGELEIDNKIINANYASAFVAKFSTDGKCIYLHHLMQGSEIEVKDIIVDDEKIFITGNFWNSINGNDIKYYSKGGYDIFLAIFNENMRLKSMTALGGPLMDEVSGITKFGSNVVMYGNFEGNLLVNENEFKSIESSDCFMFHFALDGSFMDGESFGGVGQDKLNGVQGSANNVFYTGSLRNTISKDGQSITSTGLSDILVGKLNISNRYLIANGKESKVGISVFPNPGFNYITIKAIDPMTEINISDLSGHLIMKKEIDHDKQEVTIKIDDLITGVYLIKVVTSAGTSESRLVVSK
jgi:hypothetical protein